MLGPLAGFISRRALWPAVGNHDYYGLANYRRYFALPGNERYYSFTYGGVLFMALDSNRYNRAQKSWARRKLGASKASCKVAYFHHPLWSSGRGYRSHVRHPRRQKIARILEKGGVDLVLNGHVQHYERSKPLRRGRRSRAWHRLRGHRRGRRSPDTVRDQTQAPLVRAARESSTTACA